MLLLLLLCHRLYLYDADAPAPSTAAPLYCVRLGAEAGRVPLVQNADTRNCPDPGVNYINYMTRVMCS